MEIVKWPDGLPRSGNKKFNQLKSVSSWFEIYQINRDTYAIFEPNHDEEVFSYLVLGEIKAALIDTGMGIGNMRDEVEQITNLPIVVVNTHTHFDHTGDNFRFREISCFDNDYERNNLIQGHSNDFCRGFMHPGSYRHLPNDFNPETYAIKPSQLTHPLKHLDRIDLGNRTLIIHHTPGHSPGSICIQDLKLKILFTGDTYYYGTIFVDLPGSNPDDFYESSKYLVSLLDDIDFLCPSHNEAYASKEVIKAIADACHQISSEQATFRIKNGARLYSFKHFNLRLP